MQRYDWSEIMFDREIQRIRELLIQLASQDSAAATDAVHHMLETLQHSIDQTSVVTVYQPREQIQSNAKVICITCLGKGERQTGSNLVASLDRKPKPKYITPTPPGTAPEHCRWVCWLCDGTPHIFTKSADLRNHFKSLHGYSEEEIKEIFSTRNGKKLYEHFGPCTGADAEKNGWNTRSFTAPRKRRRSEMNTSAQAVQGTKSQEKQSYASVAKANNASSSNAITSSFKVNPETMPAPLDNALKSPTINIQGIWPTPAETRQPEIQAAKPSGLDPSQSGVGNQFEDELFAMQTVNPADVYGASIDDAYPMEFSLLQTNYSVATHPGSSTNAASTQHRMLAPNSWSPELGIDHADLRLNVPSSPYASEILTWADGSVVYEMQPGIEEEFDGMGLGLSYE